MIKSARDLLAEAKELIETKGWGQGYFSHDANSKRIGPWQEEATSFCAIGALIAACSKQRFAIARDEEYKDLSAQEKQVLLDAFDLEREKAKCKLTIATGATHVPTWNDDPSRTKQDVIDVYEKAIISCGAE